MNRRITHFFYIVTLGYMSLLVQAQVSPIVPGEALWCITQRIGETTDTILEKVNSLLDCPCTVMGSTTTCLPTAITQSMPSITLSTAGNYCLATDITGSFSITGECITLDLNNRCVTGLVSINANRVQLINGTIFPPATMSNNDPAGIAISNGVMQVLVSNVIIDCQAGSVDPSINNRVGLEVAGASQIMVRNCISKNGSIGFLYNAVTNSTLENCFATKNQMAGISLVDSQKIKTTGCKASLNGLGSETGFGFVSTDGTGNIFKNCIAEGTTTNTADWESIAAGFALTGSEMCSIITNCISSNNGATMPLSLQETASGNIISSGTPYGILLQYDLVNGGSPVNIATVLVHAVSVLASVNWSPDGKYIAAVATVGNSLLIFNATNPSMPVLAGSVGTDNAPQSVNWSPDGRYIAVVNSTGNTLQIFNATNPSAPVLAGSIGTNTHPISVNWSPNGRYIAVVNNVSSTLQIFNATNPAAPVVAGSVGTSNNPLSVNWSPDGRYIAVVNFGSPGLQIFNATNPSAPVLAGSVGTDAAPNSVNWSPDGRYIAVVNFNVNTLQIFNATNPSAPVLAGSIGTNAHPISANWSPDGRYIAVVNTINNTLQIFNATNPSAPVLAGSVGTALVGNPLSVNWSPDGRYIAVVTIASLQIFNTLSFPISNTVSNNLVDCTSTPTTTYARGIGISGSSGVNIIINNITYNSPLNYAFIDNGLNASFCDIGTVCSKEQ